MMGSLGMAWRYSFGLHAAADGLVAAIAGVLAAGFRTADIRGEGGATVSTSEMGDAIVKELAQQAAESLTDEENYPVRSYTVSRWSPPYPINPEILVPSPPYPRQALPY